MPGGEADDECNQQGEAAEFEGDRQLVTDDLVDGLRSVAVRDPEVAL